MKNFVRTAFFAMCFLALMPMVLAFTDVDSTHYYFAAIDYVEDAGIVNGYDDGSYKPDNEINRAEFTKIIIEATFEDSEIEDCSGGKTFSDVAKSEWYAKYVCVASSNGIIDGYDDGTFKGADKINFVEAAKIIVTGFDYEYEEGDEWYEGYVQVLQDNNYIPSTIDSLSKEITRGEMAEMIWRIREQITEKSSPELLVETPEPVTPDSSDYPGWSTYSGDGYAFYHPNWYQGEKWGYVTLSPQSDFIYGSDNYSVDEYVQTYTVSGSNLETSVWFDHPFVESENLAINGLPALMRHYRAPSGTVVNGRTTGENENIYIYTYLLDGKVGVLQYFNAYGTENKNVDTFFDIAGSFYQK